MPRFIDLSHPIEDGMDAYPGLPSPRIDAHLDHAASRAHYDGKAGFYIGRVEMVGNLGTYIDSPFHRYPDREDLSRLSLDRIAAVPGPDTLVPKPSRQAFGCGRFASSRSSEK